MVTRGLIARDRDSESHSFHCAIYRADFLFGGEGRYAKDLSVNILLGQAAYVLMRRAWYTPVAEP